MEKNRGHVNKVPRSNTNSSYTPQDTPNMASTLSSLEKFDCDGEPGSVGLRWEKWKRAFHIFLEAANIEKEETKKATLLHTGGLGLQKIFYSIPRAQGSGGYTAKSMR